MHNRTKLQHDRINNNVKNPRWPMRNGAWESFECGKVMYGNVDWVTVSLTPGVCKVARRLRFWAKSFIYIDILDYNTNANRYGIFFSNITIIYVPIELKP